MKFKHRIGLCIGLGMSLWMLGCGNAADPSAGERTETVKETCAVPEESDGSTAAKTDRAEAGMRSTEEAAGTAEEAAGVTEETAETTEKEETMAATLLYQGHASIRIVTGDNKVIYVDPFMGEGYDLPADLILMTHGHYDHTQDNMIEKKNEGCTLIKWTDALKNGVYQTSDLGYVKVEPVEAGYNKNHDASECVGFVLTFPDGIKVYLSGDTSTTPSMPELAKKEIDYAFLCCEGVYNMDVKEASECAKVIGAKHTIPYHMEPVKDKTGFDQAAADAFEAPGKLILRPGEELELK